MQGFTPWEVSLIKWTYHRHDSGRKGFWDVRDLEGFLGALEMQVTDKQLRAMFTEKLDADGDNRVSFDEFLAFLSRCDRLGEREAHLRRAVLNDYGSLAAGAAVGLIPALKGKLLILIGSLFTDPIRFFRDYYVEYHMRLETEYKRVRSKQHSASNLGLWQLMIAHGRVGKNFAMTLWWIIYAILLDTSVGALMFLCYARSRAALGSSDLFKDQSIACEFAAGFTGGAVSGVLERPARFMARNSMREQLRNVSAGKSTGVALVRRMFEGVRFSVLRNTLSHGCFFSTFFVAQENFRRFVFQKMEVERTSWREAFVVVGAGCTAGGAFKSVSIPLTNMYVHVTKEGNCSWRDFAYRYGTRQRFAIASKGWGQGMLWTMPVTGVAFLIYEGAFIWR